MLRIYPGKHRTVGFNFPFYGNSIGIYREDIAAGRVFISRLPGGWAGRDTMPGLAPEVLLPCWGGLDWCTARDSVNVFSWTSMCRITLSLMVQ